jgi:cell division protein FtsZ
MVLPGLINLDFADVRTVMTEMGKAMMGTGEASGEARAMMAAQNAIQNPLLDEVSLKGAKAVLVNVTGGPDMTLLEVDEACNAISAEVDPDANTIFGAAFDDSLTGKIRVSVVATGMDGMSIQAIEPKPIRITAPATRIEDAPAPPPVEAQFEELDAPEPESAPPVAAMVEAEPQPILKLVDPAVADEVDAEFQLTAVPDPAAPQIITARGEREAIAEAAAEAAPDEAPLFIPPHRQAAQKGGWRLGFFGRQRPEPAEQERVPQFHNKNAAAGSRGFAATLPAEEAEAEQDDLEIPSFLRRLAN